MGIEREAVLSGIHEGTAIQTQGTGENVVPGPVRQRASPELDGLGEADAPSQLKGGAGLNRGG